MGAMDVISYFICFNFFFSWNSYFSDETEKRIPCIKKKNLILKKEEKIYNFI